MKQEQYEKNLDRLKAVTIQRADLKNYIKPPDLLSFYQDISLLAAADHADAEAYLKLVEEKLANYPILDTLLEISKSDFLLRFDPTENHGKKRKESPDDIQDDQAIINISNEIIDIVKDMKERYPELKKDTDERA